MTLTKQLAELKAAAERATPGPWKLFVSVARELIGVGPDNGPIARFNPISENFDKDAAYVAACSPDRILSLVAEVERLVEANRWIPVSERLPEPLKGGDSGLEVLLIIASENRQRLENGIWHGADGGDAKCFWVGKFGWNTDDDYMRVTHWRPLPAPPDHLAAAGKMEGGK